MTRRNSQQSLMHGQSKRTKPTREYNSFTPEQCKLIEDFVTEWRPVIGWEDLYLVSDTGYIKHKKYGHILWRNELKNGYWYVRLSRDGHSELRRIHRLVAMAFHPLPDRVREEDYDGLVVHHIDGNRHNADETNLMFCDSAYNSYFDTEDATAERELIRAEALQAFEIKQKKRQQQQAA